MGKTLVTLLVVSEAPPDRVADFVDVAINFDDTSSERIGQLMDEWLGERSHIEVISAVEHTLNVE